MNLPEPEPTGAGPVERSLGQRLRDGRLARGLSIADVAVHLKAPTRIVEAIERDQTDRLGAVIYVRGYLLSYARLVGVSEQAVLDELAVEGEPVPVPLHSSTQTSHARFLLDRYARKGAYLVLTASIVLPVLWFKDQFSGQPLALRSLDAPIGVPAAPVASDSGTAAPAASAPELPLPMPPADDELTVVASLTPFYQSPANPADPVAAPPPAAEPAVETAADSAGWELVVNQDSWVEVLGADGRRLEFGLLRAGTRQRYPAGAVASVALGNADGVELRRDGQTVELAPFRRANVARFTVSSDGRLLPSGG